VKFDENGDPSGNSYELMNWQLDENGQVQFKVVGGFKSSAPPEKQLHITNNTILWNDGTHKESTSLVLCDMYVFRYVQSLYKLKDEIQYFNGFNRRKPMKQTSKVGTWIGFGFQLQLL